VSSTGANLFRDTQGVIFEHALVVAAGRLGRKSGRGFYDYSAS